ncbi:glutamine synthetase family protein [Burkholderiaceae bacterium FT117]|uniref:glutamine synthetase family protein n=1 Tax=Zeimonas sediminis TaxID=2944268 RepID=UPI002343210E|nr:glutamine synthetase family protein [Zeimonas sediminis]MCM5571338.1 glutamine synthetase family protein [Zeimonas sediminis]
MSFVERHGLRDQAGQAAAAQVAERIRAEGLEVVRVVFADQHGLLRGKTLVAAEAIGALQAGVGLVGTNLLKDSSDRTAWPVFTPGAGMGSPEFEGASDVVIVPDPLTFRVLPWSPRSGWIQCDAWFTDGRPVPFDTRRVYRDALARLAQAGYDYKVGLEVEFHVYRIDDARIAPERSGWPGEPPQVSLLNTGYRLLAEQRYDQLEPVVELLRGPLLELGLPLRSMEVELGPSQIEFVFGAMTGMDPADAMVLFRSATKQVLRRHGYHATFMCRPRLPNVMSSGWHLHQSLVSRTDGGNAFAGAGRTPDDCLTPTGRHFLGGLLAHARGASVFATPTINGYRRFRANSLAPDRATWGCDNRGAMVRVIGGGGDAGTRLENRAGEPAANPYLFMAAQVHAGLDGIARRLDPGPSADTPYEANAPLLPRSLEEALAALREDRVMVEAFGQPVVDWYTRIKRAEIARFEAEVTDWEHREYFEMF